MANDGQTFQEIQSTGQGRIVDDGLLELHVRRTPGGAFSHVVFDEMKERADALIRSLQSR